jgi:hypothetical protein
MRTVARLGLAVASILALSMTAFAESRIFIIANNADGYGVDRCLANGEPCGVTVATAYCQSRAFAVATSFRKIERGEITGAVPAANNACSGSCENFVAIECSR